MRINTQHPTRDVSYCSLGLNGDIWLKRFGKSSGSDKPMGRHRTRYYQGRRGKKSGRTNRGAKEYYRH